VSDQHRWSELATAGIHGALPPKAFCSQVLSHQRKSVVCSSALAGVEPVATVASSRTERGIMSAQPLRSMPDSLRSRSPADRDGEGVCARDDTHDTATGGTLRSPLFRRPASTSRHPSIVSPRKPMPRVRKPSGPLTGDHPQGIPSAQSKGPRVRRPGEPSVVP